MKNITILGATGSIGTSTLDVVSRHFDKYKVKALTANKNVKKLSDLCIKYKPDYAVMVDTDASTQLEKALHNKAPDVAVLNGLDGLIKVSSMDEVDCVMAAIVGAAGLLPTLAAAKSGKRVMLANKEALVMAGKLFMDAVHENKVELLPIDSEHNAIFQCMPIDFSDGFCEIGVKNILLTASGGPFLNMPLAQFASIKPEQACAHPNWSMGRKISVDSATMMNKGLELIEACWLFNTVSDNIEIIIHPQSVIHSMVEYNDGSILAQLGNPDMRTPIAYGLSWPKRIDSGVKKLNLLDVARLDFEKPDHQRFPCLELARQAMQQGGTSSAILNAANEVAVQEFLSGRILFTDIVRIIEDVMAKVTKNTASTLDVILEDDKKARECAFHVANELSK